MIIKHNDTMVIESASGDVNVPVQLTFFLLNTLYKNTKNNIFSCLILKQTKCQQFYVLKD